MVNFHFTFHRLNYVRKLTLKFYNYSWTFENGWKFWNSIELATRSLEDASCRLDDEQGKILKFVYSIFIPFPCYLWTYLKFQRVASSSFEMSEMLNNMMKMLEKFFSFSDTNSWNVVCVVERSKIELYSKSDEEHPERQIERLSYKFLLLKTVRKEISCVHQKRLENTKINIHSWRYISSRESHLCHLFIHSPLRVE